MISCVCVCLYVCMYVCMYVCVYVMHVYVCIVCSMCMIYNRSKLHMIDKNISQVPMS